MQRKSSRRTKCEHSLTYVLAISFAVCTPAVLADQRDVINAQQHVRQMGENQKESSTAYFLLACAYLEDEKHQKAFDAFDKASAIEKRMGIAFDGGVGLHMDWAHQLAEHYKSHKQPELLREATRAIAGATLAAKKTPLHNSVWYHLQMIEFFRDVGMKTEVEKQIRILDSALATVEQGPLERYEITQIGSALKQLAAMYSHQLTTQEILQGTKTKVQVVSDSEQHAPHTIKKSDFCKAECYLLRANQVHARLPESSYIRIREQRELVFWFRYYGRKSQEEFQTRQLAMLVHSNDPKILFPREQLCLGCGRG